MFFALFWLFFNQIKQIEWNKWHDFTLQNPLFFVIVVLLVFVNWGIEYLKWTEVLKFSKVVIPFEIKLKSFLAGIITGLLTPNMIGNFIGRIFYFQRRERPAIILLTLFANAAQFLASMLFGLIALLWLGLPAKNFSWTFESFLVLSFLSIGLLALLYFKFEKIPLKIIRQNKYVLKISPLMETRSYFRSKLVVLSIARHFVFSLQYWLLLQAFGVEINLQWFGWIWQVFFWATLIPSLWFGKLVIRESMALWILAPLTSNPALILFTSVFLWILNQAIPAATGIPYLGKQKSSTL